MPKNSMEKWMIFDLLIQSKTTFSYDYQKKSTKRFKFEQKTKTNDLFSTCNFFITCHQPILNSESTNIFHDFFV